MKLTIKKIRWSGLGLTLAVVMGVPAWADDTELLLVTPADNLNQLNPNILLILDSSGSMATVEETIKPYDSTEPYVGECDSDRMYWNQTGLVPTCDEDNNSFVAKDSFVCKKAQRQMTGIGLYQGLLVQYREDNTGAERWNTLATDASQERVECRADSGIDGSGSLTYAQAGTDVAQYTADADKEISWGSYPASEYYTIYDGNYLNWRATPETIMASRIDIMKTATKIALESIDDSNIGIMRFNRRDGGAVIQGLVDLDDNRATLASVVDGFNFGGKTPLSEVLYESALYWLGEPAYFGQRINQHTTDPGALASSSPEVYQAPNSPACTRNFNVLLSDGDPSFDEEGLILGPTLPGFEDKLKRNACTGTGMGDCLDDVSEYLSIPDLSTSESGDQSVTTHTIGFAIDLPILKRAAEISGGDYYLADDIESLTLALLRIFNEANDQVLAFTSPAVSVNAFNRTQNLNDLYMTVFRSQVAYHWPGNLKKYRLKDRLISDANGIPAVDPATGFFNDSAKSFWTNGGADGANVEAGGAANQLPAPATRKLYTNNGAADLTAGSNAISASNSMAYSLADFGLSGAVGEPTLNQMIGWLRGSDVLDEDSNPQTMQRDAMGDPLHAQPATIVYGGAPGNEDVVVYSATNDGYLHAIDAETGAELWSFIPNELLSRAAALMINPSSNFKSYGIDGDVVPVFLDRNDDGLIRSADLDFAYIVFGLRRGGGSYYALDVTDKDSPRLLWNVSLPGMGQSWSRPTVTRVNLNDNALNSDKAVVILGTGYDSVHDTPVFPSVDDNAGTGVVMLDMKTGAELWRAGREASDDLILPNMTRSIPSQIRVIDLDGNGFADRMYAADVGGQLWRFDILGGEAAASLVTGGVIAQLGAEGIAGPSAAETRRTYNTPDAAIFSDNLQNRRFISINIGTGYRAHPLDTSASDVFYSFRDPDVFNRLTQAEYNTYDVAENSDFVEVSGSVQAVIDAIDRGWKFSLPTEQMVLSNSAVFDDEVFFVAFSPAALAAQDCSVSVGKNFLYRVSILNGDPIVPNIATVTDPLADEYRVTELRQGGIAPAPQFLFPSPDDPNCTGDACSPPPIGCVGVECFEPGFANNPVRTLWTQDGVE